MAETLPQTENKQTAAILEKYRNFYNSGVASLISLVLPLAEAYAEGMYIYGYDMQTAPSAEPQRYLDFLGGHGVFNVGHRHPKVIQAVKEQLEKYPLVASKVILDETLANLAEKLAQITPGSLSQLFPCNSGTEAVEAALKLARAKTGRQEFVAAVGGFHGKSFGSLSVSGREVYKTPFQPLLPEVKHVPFGDVAALKAAVTERTAAVILEPIQGEGGVNIPPRGYLKQAQEVCQQKGALLIVDEVQTGLGRTGKMFACEYEGVEPDILCLAKALGGGVVPFGVMMATPEAFAPFAENPFLHTSTFGGCSLGAAAALATIKVIEEEKLAAAAAEKGSYFLTQLQTLKEKYPQLVKDVRGRGLLIGLELVNEGVAGSIIYEMDHKKVIILQMLNNPKVLRFEPPLIVTKEQIDYVLQALDEALANSQGLEA